MGNGEKIHTSSWSGQRAKKPHPFFNAQFFLNTTKKPFQEEWLFDDNTKNRAFSIGVDEIHRHFRRLVSELLVVVLH